MRDVSPTASAGEVIGLVGPNGSGKSSLLRAVYRVLRPDTGTVRVDGADTWSMPARRLARTVAAVAQDSAADFDLAVREVVAMGRTPHKRTPAGDTAEDAAVIDHALAVVDADRLADRPFDRLSGGERRRVLIARALAQRPALLVLDEATTTSPSAISWTSSTCCAGCRRPCCSPRTTSTWPRTAATAPTSCARGRSRPRARRPRCSRRRCSPTCTGSWEGRACILVRARPR
ncbi:ABC-type transport system involved in cytochrome c biogenesis ATPase subunit [Streptomyces sp. DSM 40167]|nr:ABC-type transport system involved in cytochrome c biogenesis ATPase subunit [Streptomyces sp. DSM 40167]